MKKVLMLFLIVITIFSAFTMVYASDEIKVLLNDKEINFTDEAGNKVSPQIINNRTMVPMRKIFEILQANVSWDAPTQTVTASNDKKTITLTIGDAVARVEESGEKEEVLFDSVPVIVEGRTLVPVRLIAELLDLNVGWEADTKTVVIIDASFVEEMIKEYSPTFYEFFTTNLFIINTFVMDADIEASLKYTDTKNISNNTNVKVIIDGEQKKSEDKLEIEASANATGKGILYELMKKNELNNIDLRAILDINNERAYVKSSLIEEIAESKWVELVYTNDEMTKEMLMVNSNATTLTEITNNILNQTGVTSQTYEVLNFVTKIVCSLTSDKLFTVRGRTTKIYEYNITLKDILNILSENMPEELTNSILEMYDAELNLSTKVENGKVTESQVKFSGLEKVGTETVELKVEGTTKMKNINSKVNISLPNAQDIAFTENIQDLDL